MSTSAKALSITFDSLSVYAQIEGINLDEYTWSQIYLICSAHSDNLENIPPRRLIIPWSEFRYVISSLAQFISKEKMQVIYDDESKRLIYEYYRDIDYLSKSAAGKSIPFVEVEDIESTLTSAGFTRNLTKEQVRDAQRLLGLRHGANFSVPGAGKTTTLLAVHSILKYLKIVTKLLVIAPRNAFMSWEEEIRLCFNDRALKPVRLSGGKANITKQLNEDPEIALINYHQIPYVIDDVSLYVQRNAVHIVLDEAHRIKRGMSGVHYSNIIRIADVAIRRDILTGTPMPQSTLDIVPQFDYLWPGGDILDEIMNVNDEDKRVKITNKLIKHLYVRTKKNELGLSPPKINITKITLGSVQRELYQLLRSETARLISGLNRQDLNAFRNLGRHIVRLLQVASNPMLLTASDEYPDEIQEIPTGTRKWELLTEFSKYEKPAKIEYIVKRVRDITDEGNKVVVWSSFIRNIELLERIFTEYGPVSIYGGIETGSEEDSETREGRIRRFHEDASCKVLIANPAACGEGISLHKICHNAIYLDRNFNAAHYLQSIDRIHRLGLPANIVTNVEIIEALDTIDIVVEERLRSKINNMSRVLEDSDLNALAYDPEDVIETIPGGIDQSDIDEIQKHLTKET